MNIHTDFKIEFHVIQVFAVISLLINLFQSGSGYIINEDGQLVPFKIYKKGNHGSRMCFLHPRNCRGGFHKRLIGNPHNELGNNGFDFQIRKRQQKQQQHSANNNNNKNGSPFLARRPSDIFDPRSGTQLFPKPLQSDTNKLGTRYMSDDELYSIFPSLKTKYNSNTKNGKSKTVVTSLENMHEANQLLNDLSRGFGEVEDSSPAKTRDNIKSEQVDYTEYDLWTEDYSNIYNTDNESKSRRKDDTDETEKMIFYQYGPGYQVQWDDV